MPPEPMKMKKQTSAETAALLSSLSGRKRKARMGADLDETVAVGPSDFARAQLEKMGWTEGTGLGKNRNGMKTHIKVEKREDGRALGASKVVDAVVTGDQWWKSSVGSTLARLQAKKKSKKKKKKSEKKDEKDEDDGRKAKKKRRKLEYTDEELFEATGGARFGMRAQTRQTGKWNRAEEAITKDQENKALAGTEWDGMAAPRVILSSSSSSSKNEEKKKQKKKKDDDASESPSDDHDDDDDERGGPEKKSKKEKKVKKDKKKKKTKKQQEEDGGSAASAGSSPKKEKRKKDEAKKKKEKKKKKTSER